VDQHPEVVTFAGAHIDEFVGVASAAVGVAGDLLQLAVERAVGGAPVDLGVDAREQQREELGEEALEGFFPGAVLVALRKCPSTSSRF
jgi:hypothetical protein